MQIILNIEKRIFVLIILGIFLISFISITGAQAPSSPNPGHFADQVNYSTPITGPVEIGSGSGDIALKLRSGPSTKVITEFYNGPGPSPTGFIGYSLPGVNHMVFSNNFLGGNFFFEGLGSFDVDVQNDLTLSSASGDVIRYTSSDDRLRLSSGSIVELSASPVRLSDPNTGWGVDFTGGGAGVPASIHSTDTDGLLLSSGSNININPDVDGGGGATQNNVKVIGDLNVEKSGSNFDVPMVIGSTGASCTATCGNRGLNCLFGVVYSGGVPSSAPVSCSNTVSVGGYCTCFDPN